MIHYMSSLFKNQQYSKQNFFLIAGPCVVENETMVKQISSTIYSICQRLEIPFVFKASYRKANRTSATSFTGMGDEKALNILRAVKEDTGLPITTDIHTAPEAAFAAEVADILQIPAFLCRQSDILTAAAQTDKIVNIKKGQFVSGEAMKFAVEKVQQAHNEKILLTERGTTFGYQDLVVDYRNIPIMKAHGVPVVMDCTHSLQQPNQTSGVTGGNPQLIATIAKAAIATGADGLFIETHPDPANAKSDGANMLNLSLLENLLVELVKIRAAVHE